MCPPDGTLLLLLTDESDSSSVLQCMECQRDHQVIVKFLGDD